jgi:hypothetical protein
MVKKMVLAFLVMVLPAIISCDNSSSGGDDERAALESFDMAFRPSAETLTGNFYDATSGSIEDILAAQDEEFWVENPVLETIIDLGLSGANEESIAALVTLIKNGVLNPWSLLDTTSLNGKHGCVSWSTGVNFDLQLVEAVVDLFNGKWWTLTVQAAMEDCGDVSGDLNVEIAGSRLGVVYTVHVTGELTVASMPDKTFDLDVTYDLKNCFTTWDCVDWSGTVNGYKIKDLY